MINENISMKTKFRILSHHTYQQVVYENVPHRFLRKLRKMKRGNEEAYDVYHNHQYMLKNYWNYRINKFISIKSGRQPRVPCSPRESIRYNVFGVQPYNFRKYVPIYGAINTPPVSVKSCNLLDILNKKCLRDYFLRSTDNLPF